MQASTYVEAFTARGVLLWREGDTLRFDAPVGVLTPAVLQKLRQAKPKLLPLLPTQPANQPPARPVATPGEGDPARLHNLGIPESLSVARQTLSPIERSAWEKRFEAVVLGRIGYTWPTHTQDGTPYEPVRVAQGVKADEPERWFVLAWGRYTRLRCLVGNEELEESAPTRHIRAVQDLEILFTEMVGVLDQAEFESKEKEG